MNVDISLQTLVYVQVSGGDGRQREGEFSHRRRWQFSDVGALTTCLLCVSSGQGDEQWRRVRVPATILSTQRVMRSQTTTNYFSYLVKLSNNVICYFSLWVITEWQVQCINISCLTYSNLKNILLLNISASFINGMTVVLQFVNTSIFVRLWFCS